MNPILDLDTNMFADEFRAALRRVNKRKGNVFSTRVYEHGKLKWLITTASDDLNRIITQMDEEEQISMCLLIDQTLNHYQGVQLDICSEEFFPGRMVFVTRVNNSDPNILNFNYPHPRHRAKTSATH